MLRNIFGNLQPVVKNLLIINALFFLATVVMQNKGIFLSTYLGLFYPDSPLFEPYQFATHFFMHGGFRHFFFNMIALLVFGNMLERIWGAKKMLTFFFIVAIGAAIVHVASEAVQVYQLTGTVQPFSDNWFMFARNKDLINEVLQITNGPAVGASGAIYGLIIGAALLFPNTELYIYGVLPLKVKWLALIAVAYDVLSIYQDNPLDNTAHFAHLGGAVVGFILIKVWQRNSNTFY